MKNNVKQSLVVVAASLVLTIVAMIIAAFAFMGGAIQKNAESNDLLSIYEETTFDYVIKNPSTAQIDEFSSNSSINKIVPYYQLVYTFKIANEDVEITLKSVENCNDLECTEFSEARLVKSDDVSGNKIFIDYNLSKQYGLEIGDTIGSNVMQFVVAGYYQNYNAYLAFVPNLNDIVSAELECAGVYVDVKNEANFKETVVNNYKPLATLKDRESFSDDAAYQTYLDNFNSRDYSTYIIEKNLGYEEAQESFNNKIGEAKSEYLTAGIVAGVIVLVGFVGIALLLAKKTKYEVVDGARRSVIFRYIIGSGVSIVGIVITWIIGTSATAAKQLHYIAISDVLTLGIVSLLIPIIAAVIGAIINIAIVSGYKEKKK